jgi:hypothetical protein
MSINNKLLIRIRVVISRSVRAEVIARRRVMGVVHPLPG